MASLVDFQIRNLCRNIGLVEPFNPEMVNPASIDVTLGGVIKVEGRSYGRPKDRARWINHEIDSDKGFILPPGGFILAHTNEYVRIPNNLESNFQLKSSRGREGINHLLAGYIDPGFKGQITLELQNVNSRHNVVLKKGMRIGQLRFHTLSEIPLRSYAVTGRYFLDEGAVASKG